MSKIIRLNESQLSYLIKRVIKEVDDQAAEQEGEELKNDIENINTQLSSELSSENIDPSKILTPESVCKSGGKDPIDEYISKQNFKSEEDKNLVRDFLNSLKGLSVWQLLGKIKELKVLLKKNKNKTVSEDIQKLSANPFLLIALAPLIIIGILILIKSGLFRPNYCRRWSVWKQTKMSGYGGRGW